MGLKARPAAPRSTKARSMERSTEAPSTETLPPEPLPTEALPTEPKKHRIFTTSFASVYPLYVQKAANKGRTQAEVDELIAWLTGYDAKDLQRVLDAKLDFESFFAQAPQMNAKVGLITGVVCGLRVEEIADPLMRKIRYLDKLVDELAKGKKMQSILRS